MSDAHLIIMACAKAARRESARLREAGQPVEACGAMSVAELLLTEAERAQQVAHRAGEPWEFDGAGNIVPRGSSQQ